jgi:type 2A phosphatase activator TIP41
MSSGVYDVAILSDRTIQQFGGFVFQLRVDGILMRLRDTRMFSAFSSNPQGAPVVLRERCTKEDNFRGLASRGFPDSLSAYKEPSTIADFLQTRTDIFEKLVWVEKRQ